MKWAKAFIVCAILWTAAAAQAPEGIPRELARQRATDIGDVRYQLNFQLLPGQDSTFGREELKFTLKTAKQEWLDFRGNAISKLTINGATAPGTMQSGHVDLPANLLKAGENVIDIEFTAPVARAGAALTRFEDIDDGSTYIYTLFVPMDAEMAFPCFDQPDLKAKFTLSVITPMAWTVISNTAQTDENSAMGKHELTFAETKPIPTYLFAFAAGPFVKVNDKPGLPGLYVRKSKAQKAAAEAPEVQQVTADGIKFLSDYFAQPFPFPKYDLVLIPGFAYGGMEHAGATFVREESVLFRTAPTHTDLVNRDLLLLHELTHQWFGDLVTMRWFDDLWLKEGFAQYMASYALNALKPQEDAWRRFYLAQKPQAYAIDSTQGTTPIYQDITNLKDAKSAYGAIVYAKAPGVIKQLAFGKVGEQNFRDGLRLYLKEHAYGNAEWSDLIGALQRTLPRTLPPVDLSEWANAYIKRRGMAEVDVSLTCHRDKNVAYWGMNEHNVLGDPWLWPISTKVMIQTSGKQQVYEGGFDHSIGPFQLNRCPDYIFANYQDLAYGRFLLDARSQKYVVAHIGETKDLFLRTMLWGSLWDAVRQAEMDPREYIELALRELPNEDDEALAQSILGRTSYAIHRYVSPQVRAQLGPEMETLAKKKMLESRSQDMRIAWFRAFRGVAETASAQQDLEDILAGKLVVPGVELRPLDRWNIVATLVALGDPHSDAILAAEEKRDPSGDGKKYAYMARAARPTPETKKQYFDDYLHDATRPEDWVEQSLGAFNYWNQWEITEPYLKPALEALPQVKRQRKIFFLLTWLNAFIGGQQTPEADAQVHEYLKTADLDKDLRLKILEVVDELDRTVKIRSKYK